MTADQLGRELLRHRKARGQSRRAQAAALGVNPNTLRELEYGLANPTLARIDDLAGKLGLTVTIALEERPQ